MNLDDFFIKEEPADSYMKLCRFILSCSDEDKNEVLGQWDGGFDWVFLHATDIPMLHEKYSPKERAEACLVFDWLENEPIDFRDVLVGWGVVYNGLIVAGERPRVVFKNIGLALGKKIGQDLVDFSERSDDDLGMRAFGLKYNRDSEGRIIQVTTAW